MAKYLITGGAGFIGSHLSEVCLRFGHYVICVDNGYSSRPSSVAHLQYHARFKFVQEDVANRTVIHDLVNDADVIIHLAAEPVMDTECRQQASLIKNYQSTYTLLNEAASSCAKVIIVSCGEIYRAADGCERRENGQIGVFSGDAKHWGEAVSSLVDECLANESSAPTIVARLFTTIGPGQNHRWGAMVMHLFKQALAGKELTVPGDGERRRSYVYISDVVHWLMLLSAFDEAVGQVYNLGNPQLIRDRDLAKKVQLVTDAPVGIACTRTSATSPENENSPTRPDISKISKLTGYVPRVGLDDALRRIHKWLLSEGGWSTNVNAERFY